MLNDINNCTIQSGLHSDHRILKLDLNTDKRNTGRGFWKFNNDLLHETDYVHLIKKTISDCKRNLHQYTNKGLVWELTKLKIRSASIPYFIKKKKQLTAFKDNLEKERNLLQEYLDSNPSDINFDQFNTAKNELEQAENMKHVHSCLDPKPNELKMVKKIINS